jgi:hypothetical protein
MTGLRISPDLTLPLDAATGTFGVLATKGAGKSNAAVTMAERMYDAGIPWVAVDPKGDWYGVRSSADGQGPGLPVVVFGGRHGDVDLEPTAGVLIADLVLRHRLTCVLDVSQFTKAETTRFLLAFGRHLFAHADDDGAEPLHLFLEEAHEYLPQVVKGDQAELVSVWQRIVKQGRFKGLGCTLISQRSSVLNKDVLELIDTLIVLRTIGPRSRQSIKDWVQDQDVDPKLLASLPGLADGEAWVWSPGALRILKRIQFDRRRTFDSGATPKVGQKRRPPATLADVDLAAIKEAMAETIERAAAEDPKQLRKRIAQLERDLAAERAKPAPTPERVEVSVLPEDVVARLEATFDKLSLAQTEWAEQLEQQTFLTNETIDQLTLLRALIRTTTEDHDREDVPRTRPAVHRPDPVATPRTQERPDPTPRRQPRRPTIQGITTPTDLGKGERVILTAVAQYDQGVTREQLIVLTGYKRSSRDTYLQRLKAAGFVESHGSQLVVTAAGVEALGDDFEPLPTGQALRQHWLNTLSGGERALLEQLIHAWPDPVDREELSLQTGYKRSSRDTYLQRLRARQLITTDGHPRAADTLFDGGSR